MTDESRNIGTSALGSVSDMGELKFEFLSEEQADSDRKFSNSVKNLLILVKDFYGADSAVVYWFNKSKNSFKLLASTEDNQKVIYTERFDAGEDLISGCCLNKRATIFNLDNEDKRKAGHLHENYRIQSLIVNPLIFDDEVIAVVLCESKTLNFFGTPNLYSLRVFSESITNYIKYYSLNEDFEHENRILILLASNGLSSRAEICNVIRRSFERILTCESFAVIMPRGRELVIIDYHAGENGKGIGKYEGKVEEGSLCRKAFKSKKIIVYNLGQTEQPVYRFSKQENLASKFNFCCIPFLLDESCLGLVALESREDLHLLQSQLGKAYKLCYPLFLLLSKLDDSGKGLADIIDRDTGFYNCDFFNLRLDSDISRNRLFNESSLYCILTGVDNIDSFLDTKEIRSLFESELKNSLGGYDMIFRLGENKYAVLMNVSADEKVFLELEKIRKAVSSKIYNLDGKEVSYTVSFAIKKYDDMNLSGQAFLEELNNLLELARSEGGNCVKI